MELTTCVVFGSISCVLFMMSKIQNLNGTHNEYINAGFSPAVVYDVKDTKFEWNSQHKMNKAQTMQVVYDVKDTKFEWNSQQTLFTYFRKKRCL